MFLVPILGGEKRSPIFNKKLHFIDNQVDCIHVMSKFNFSQRNIILFLVMQLNIVALQITSTM